MVLPEPEPGVARVPVLEPASEPVPVPKPGVEPELTQRRPRPSPPQPP